MAVQCVHNLLVVALILFSVQVNAAPLVSDYNSQELDDNSTAYELTRALIDGIYKMNNTENINTIKKTFRPGTNKICIPITYDIYCTNQPRCEDDNHFSLNCTQEGLSFTYIWTDFDTSKQSGQLLYFFASDAFPVFGFDWADACPIKYYDANFTTEFVNITQVPVVDISIFSLPCSLDNITLLEALEYITTLMPNFAILEKPPTPFDEEVTGYAENIDNIEINYNNKKYSYLFIFWILTTFVTLNALPIEIINQHIKMKLKRVTVLQGNKMKRKIKIHKPKLYYHFWSALVVFICLIFIYSLDYMNKNIFYSSILTVYTIFGSLISTCHVFGCIIIGCTKIGYMYIDLLVSMCKHDHKSTRKIDNIFVVICDSFSPLKNITNITFTVPLIDICAGSSCFSCCYIFLIYLETFLVNIILLYFLYAIPTIVLVYYLYPTRTLIRVPFIISALFYTIAFGAYLLYQVETLLWIFCTCCKCKKGKKSLTSLEKKYYQDIILTGINKYLLLYFIVKWFQLMATMQVLCLFVYGELQLAELVFTKSNNLTQDADVNNFLVLLPTIVLTIGTWYGRGLFFDLKKDLRELEETKLTEKQKILVMKLKEEDIEEEKLDITDNAPNCSEIIRIVHKKLSNRGNDEESSNENEMIIFEEIISENLEKYFNESESDQQSNVSGQEIAPLINEGSDEQHLLREISRDHDYGSTEDA